MKKTIQVREFIICSVVAELRRVVGHALKWWKWEEGLDIMRVGGTTRDQRVFIHPSSWPRRDNAYIALRIMIVGGSVIPVGGSIFHPSLECALKFYCHGDAGTKNPVCPDLSFGNALDKTVRSSILENLR